MTSWILFLHHQIRPDSSLFLCVRDAIAILRIKTLESHAPLLFCYFYFIIIYKEAEYLFSFTMHNCFHSIDIESKQIQWKYCLFFLFLIQRFRHHRSGINHNWIYMRNGIKTIWFVLDRNSLINKQTRDFFCISIYL